VRRFRKATIKDVAQRAGVSTTTVSVFVSGREDVCSPETAQRIRAAVSDLNYIPSPLVNSLQKRATTTLGVCMFSPMDSNIFYGASFFARLWRGIAAGADAAQYALLRYPTSVQDSPLVSPLLDGRADGILYHSHSGAKLDDRPARLAAAGMPVVLLTRSMDLPDGCGASFADESQTADLALTHLWDLGHRRIAHLAGPVLPGQSVERYSLVDDIAIGRLQGYQAWMRARGLDDPALVGHAHGWRGEQFVPDVVAVWRQLPEPPTAVFCANDALAASVVRAAQEQGLRVPRDLSIVGVDNSGVAAGDLVSGITSVEPPDEEVGAAGVRTLLRLIQGVPVKECRASVPVTRLVVRDSATAVEAR